jgi:peptidoglycan/LPS O-acetylase OafA/YrhL
MTERRYMRQLDALRFFAVLGVVVAHDWGPGPRGWVVRYWANLGVRLFFVLSGFLITGILARGRELGQQRPERRRAFIRQFYIRRFLRIFPIYYVVLLAVLIADVAPARKIWPWLVSYTTNIYIWHHRQWLGNIGHFWTLAVEEQFYLVWPWLMLFLPGKRLVPFLVGLVCLGPAYRLYASFHYSADVLDSGVTGTLTIAALDSLALGALLAIASSVDAEGKRLQRVLTRIVLPLGAVGLVTLLAISRSGLETHASTALDLTAASLIFCWLIGSASRGFGGRFGRLLEWRPISYVGKISYGIYIFHNLVPPALSTLARRVGIGYRDTGIVPFVASSLVTLGVAALSWHLFEAPINGLKRHFRDDGGREGQPTAPGVPPGGAAQAIVARVAETETGPS